jgi:hypothetical protein
MALFIDGPEARITRTGETSVTLELYGGQTFFELEPRRLFPMSGLTKYITLLDEELKEKAIIRDLERLDESSRRAVEECLEQYYMIPKIIEMIDITEKFGVITWTCRTDRGVRSFRIRSRTNDIKVLYDGRVLIRDSNDNRYEIDDYRTMDKKSRALLSHEL